MDIIDETRPTSWSKLLAMRKYLPYYDFLLYVDADTLVTNYDIKLEDIVDYGYDQVLAADRNGLNCGVWLIRNTPWSLWFLDEMWAQSQLVNPTSFVLFHYEQRAMHYLYQSKVWRNAVKQPAYAHANTIRARTKVVNSCVFNSYPAWYKPGDFVRAPRRSQRHREVSDVSVLLPADAERACRDGGGLGAPTGEPRRGRAHLGDVLLRADSRGTGTGKWTRVRAAAPRATLFFVRIIRDLFVF